MSLPPGLPLPKSLHWLGDKHDAEATGHEADMRGCVMYFDRQSDCLKFMRWLVSVTPEPRKRTHFETDGCNPPEHYGPTGE